MQASKPSSRTTQSHFAAPPAMPTARQPLILASWPTVWPTAPAAPETTTVSPGFGPHTSSSPKYAVMPGMPSTFSHCGIEPSRRSIFCSARAGRQAYACAPTRPPTMSPAARPGSAEASTRPMPPARITSPMPTGAM